MSGTIPIPYSVHISWGYAKKGRLWGSLSRSCPILDAQCIRPGEERLDFQRRRPAVRRSLPCGQLPHRRRRGSHRTRVAAWLSHLRCRFQQGVVRPTSFRGEPVGRVRDLHLRSRLQRPLPGMERGTATPSVRALAHTRLRSHRVVLGPPLPRPDADGSAGCGQPRHRHFRERPAQHFRHPRLPGHAGRWSRIRQRDRRRTEDHGRADLETCTTMDHRPICRL